MQPRLGPEEARRCQGSQTTKAPTKTCSPSQRTTKGTTQQDRKLSENTSLFHTNSRKTNKHPAPNLPPSAKAKWRAQTSTLIRLCGGVPVFPPPTPWYWWRPHGSLEFYSHPAVTRWSLPSWWIGVGGDPLESQVSHHCPVVPKPFSPSCQWEPHGELEFTPTYKVM